MTKVRCTFEVCDYCTEGTCDRGSISIYFGECKSAKMSHDIDNYDDMDD